MSFTNALSIANTGLAAAQSRARTIAENIANANTEGYGRRVTILEERQVGQFGAGVRVVSTDRADAGFLTADRLRLSADNTYAAERSRVGAQLVGIIGEPGVENGLFGAYARFENALRDAAATPESSILQRAAIDEARNITLEFKSITAAADSIRTSADNAIALAVDDVNAALKQLERLNAVPQSRVTPAVQDERQRLIDRVNDVIPVSVQKHDGGVRLITEGGVTLLSNHAHTVEFSGAGNVGRTQSLGAPLSGLTVDNIDITPGSGANQRVLGGQIAALFEVRDTIVPAFQDQVDGLATDLIQRFSADAVDPSKTAGVAGLFTNGTTTPPVGVTAGVAAQISLNSAIDPQAGGLSFRLRDGLGATAEGPAGNGDQLNRLIGALTNAGAAPAGLAIPGQKGAVDFVAEVASRTTFDSRLSEEAALFASTRFDIAADAELSVIGVDTDQELQQLLLIEQAYAANARVIEAVGDLLDELLRIV